MFVPVTVASPGVVVISPTPFTFSPNAPSFWDKAKNPITSNSEVVKLVNKSITVSS